ncbi:signal peptide containing protein [Theileria equi strain WA]|uniref:Signal peptide containing protein n=1 Tax=Theileria equi strain WA TaxID=1537102 RepID=L1LB71_THEEQ|nr:signal peptide containing protein [Theileria equi strain WA]EKX72519.1 signal peptide containing protein [Theileria equi strain WA]|eukprot:XP_004831971.1 signal peptide containing protein [Theileria equi strain WA]
MDLFPFFLLVAIVAAVSDYERRYGTNFSKLPSDELVEESLKTLGFGSCQRAKYDMTKIYNSILGHNPDLFLFIGDNTYPDLLCCTPECIKDAYDKMAKNESYVKFTKEVKKFDGIYDDHDYGKNDV